MSGLFSMDSKFFAALGKVADLIILNVLFLITSIPIITIGASCTALYSVTLKMVKNEESYIAKSYFKNFISNFKQATLSWLLLGGGSVFLLLEMRMIMSVGTGYIKYFVYFQVAILLILVMALVFIFPLIAQYENSFKNMLKNAILMPISRLPYAIIIIAITFAPVIILFAIPQSISMILFLSILIGFSGIGYVNSFFLKKMFSVFNDPKE